MNAKADALTICSPSRWTDLNQRLGITPDLQTYDALIRAHAETHRAYHTLDHIAACLRHLDEVQGLADNPDEIEMALWFHDAIYAPFSATNEEDSAAWATNWLRDKGLDESPISRIAQHILDTKTHETPETIDGRLMLDIDLSILGTGQAVYDAFENHIRREYRRVPSFIFRKKRKAILQRFLARERLYNTDYFFEKLETQARLNLNRAISNL